MDYTIDAKDKRLGRVASEAAVILQGKKDPSYEPRKEGGDRVLIKNIEGITVSGDKESSKMYYRHSGRIGGLKSRTFEQEFKRDPKRVLEGAVRRMLPKNRLNARRLKNLLFIQ